MIDHLRHDPFHDLVQLAVQDLANPTLDHLVELAFHVGRGNGRTAFGGWLQLAFVGRRLWSGTAVPRSHSATFARRRSVGPDCLRPKLAAFTRRSAATCLLKPLDEFGHAIAELIPFDAPVAVRVQGREQAVPYHGRALIHILWPGRAQVASLPRR
jgi:hypothetical protein